MFTPTPEQEALLEKVEKKRIEKGLNQREVAELVGLTGSALSQLKSRKYKSPEAGFKIITDYFAVKEKANHHYQEVHYAPTSVSTLVYDLIGVCQATGGLTIAVGDAGIGKTKAAQKFVEDNPANSFFINVNPCLTSIKSLLKAIASEIGAVQERSLDDLWMSVVKKLSDGTVLIFDEAQNLNIKEIETLRSFSDYTKSCCKSN